MSQVVSTSAAKRPGAQAPLLSVRGLRTYFHVEGGVAKAVDGVSFDVMPGEVLGIVGESGSGKSVASLSVMRLIPNPPGEIAGGEVLFAGKDLLKVSDAEIRRVRGKDIAMIFQEPMTSLNPVFTVGMQVTEAIHAHEKASKRQAIDRAVEMLTWVGIPDARNRLGDYPHQFSGGMRQRVMIAMALILNPALLIADEPTTALDVTTQAQILELMLRLMEERKDASIMLITHDLAVVAETCDRVIVMYGGKVQEVGTVEQIFDSPQHPYTQGLLRSLPQVAGQKQRRLQTIPGNVPAILNMPAGCKFCTRCDKVFDRCHVEEPALHILPNGQQSRCHLSEELAISESQT